MTARRASAPLALCAAVTGLSLVLRRLRQQLPLQRGHQDRARHRRPPRPRRRPWPPSCRPRSSPPARSSSAPTPPTRPTSSSPPTARPSRAWTSTCSTRCGQKFGLKTEWVPADVRLDHPGVQGGKYDIGVSSFTINAERKKQVNMVSYFNAGTQWVTAQGQPQEGQPRRRLRARTSPCRRAPCRQEEDLPPSGRRLQGRRQAGINVLVVHRPGPGHRGRRVRQGRRHAGRLARSSPTPSSSPSGKLEAARRHLRLGPLRLRRCRRTRPTSPRPSSRRSRPLKADGTYEKVLDQVGRPRPARSATSPSTRDGQLTP